MRPSSTQDHTAPSMPTQIHRHLSHTHAHAVMGMHSYCQNVPHTIAQTHSSKHTYIHTGTGQRIKHTRWHRHRVKHTGTCCQTHAHMLPQLNIVSSQGSHTGAKFKVRDSWSTLCTFAQPHNRWTHARINLQMLPRDSTHLQSNSVHVTPSG